MRNSIIIAIIAALACLSCRKAENRPESVLLITVDSLSAERLTTPNLDKIKKSGVYFTNALTPAPAVVPAVVSVMTGLCPWGHGFLADDDYVLGDEATTMGEFFQKVNWRTTAQMGASNMGPETGLKQGFDSYGYRFGSTPAELLSKVGVEPASELADDAARWVESFGDKPFFMWVHFADLDVPLDDAGAALDEIDKAVGKILQSLPGGGKNSVIVVASPAAAGEGRHGEKGHGLFLFDSTIKTPLVIAGPGIARRESDAPVSLVDIFPTLASYLNIPLPDGTQGADLSPILRGGDAKGLSNERVIVSYETFFRWGWSPLAALRTDSLKYIRAPKPELYDLKADPEESKNIAAERPDEAARLGKRLDEIETSLKRSPTPGKHLYNMKIPDKLPNPKDRAQVVPMVMEGAEALKEKNFIEAASILEKVRGIDPDNRPAPYLLAQAYGGAGQTDKAVGLLEEAVKLNPGNPVIMATLGEAYMKAGDYEKALKKFDAALAIEPSMPPVYKQMALIYRALAEHAEGASKLDGLKRALSYLIMTVRLGDKDAETFYDIGSVSMEVAQNINDEEAGENEPKSADFLKSAVNAFEATLDKAPDMADAHFALGQIFAISSNRKEDARVHLEKFLELAPDSPDTERAKQLLKSLKQQ